MYAIQSYKSFTDRSDSCKAFGRTIRDIPDFVVDSNHHVAEIFLGSEKVGIWTDTMGFVWNAGKAPLGYIATTGSSNSQSFYGFSSESDLQYYFERYNCETGMIQDPEGEVVGFWSMERSFTWISPNPFGPVDSNAENLAAVFRGNKFKYSASIVAEEPVVNLDRTVRISRFGAAVQTVEPVTTPKPKTDWAALTDAQMHTTFLERLETDNEFLRRAVVAIFEGQTSDEKTTGETKHHNGVGFNGADAAIMTNIAQRIIAKRRSLTDRELAASRKIMRKYMGQLVRITRAKVGRK